MGIAPRVTLGAASNLSNRDITTLERISAFGGAPWSINAHVINYSIGDNPEIPPDYPDEEAVGRQPLANLRGGKGIIIVQSAGNEYIAAQDANGVLNRLCPRVNGSTQIVSCENPANETDLLSPLRLSIAALNPKGFRASYSNAGSINWVTGLSGEQAEGNYGEVGISSSVPGAISNGPTIFSTDISGCETGYARNLPNTHAVTEFSIGGTAINLAKNSNCNYSHMNGTSAAAPTVTGVVALMLSANPNLSWRDVRHILATTSKQVDPNYGSAYQRNEQINLADYTFTGNTSAALTNGTSTARLDYGWQTNAAGYKYSNWYGFGLIDAAAAVAAAKATTSYKPAPLSLPAFTPLNAAAPDITVNYGKVTKLGEFEGSTDRVDALQVRLKSVGSEAVSNSASLCIGSVGIYVQSPSGTVSVLAVPYNIYWNTDKKIYEESEYALSSYAFYGERASGTWQIFAVSGTPKTQCTTASSGTVSVEYRVIASP
jgi:hypothetical protein